MNPARGGKKVGEILKSFRVRAGDRKKGRKKGKEKNEVPIFIFIDAARSAKADQCTTTPLKGGGQRILKKGGWEKIRRKGKRRCSLGRKETATDSRSLGKNSQKGWEGSHRHQEGDLWEEKRPAKGRGDSK